MPTALNKLLAKLADADKDLEEAERYAAGSNAEELDRIGYLRYLLRDIVRRAEANLSQSEEK